MKKSAFCAWTMAALVGAGALGACSSDDGPGGSGDGGSGGDGLGGFSGEGGWAGTAGDASVGGGAGVGGGGGAGGSVEGCTKLTVTGVQRLPGSSAMGAILSGAVQPALGATEPDLFRLELFEKTATPQGPGAFDLSQAPDDNYETCDHCVLVQQDLNDWGPAKVFFQQSGLLTMSVNDSPMTGKVRGSLKDVKLVEVEVDPITSQSVPVAGGACVVLESVDFDTVPNPAEAGTPCQTAKDCGDPDTMVCDPGGSGCQASQCSDTQPCATGKSCLDQGGFAAACYQDCSWPNTTQCAAGMSCEQTMAGAVGRCLSTGTGAADGPCTPAESDVSTRCVAGHTCMPELVGGNVVEKCRKMCDFWGTPGCATGTYCDAIGPACSGSGENVAVGAACQMDGAACAPGAGRYQGICLESKCRRICRVGQAGDCPASGEACDAGEFLAKGVGVCRAQPPAGWSCPWSWYGEGACDCSCSSWDKDCDNPGAPQVDCDDQQICLQPGDKTTMKCGPAPDAGK